MHLWNLFQVRLSKDLVACRVKSSCRALENVIQILGKGGDCLVPFKKSSILPNSIF